MVTKENGGATPDCIVVGAGIAGICAALYIQQTGAKVAIVDRSGPGREASSSNASILVNTKLLPVSAGLTPLALFSMLRDPSSPLNVKWSKFPAMIPWFMRFLRHSSPAEVERIARALAQLSYAGPANYDALIEEAGAQALVRSKGNIALYSDEARLEKDWNGKLTLLRSMGTPMQRIGRADIEELARGVSAHYRFGLYSPDFRHMTDQQAFVERLHALFVRKGGSEIKASVRSLARSNGMVDGIVTDAGLLHAGSVVVAAGIGSARFAAEIGEGVPHQAVGGYNIFIEDSRIPLDMPVLPMDFRFAITPMTRGLRLAGVYEFGGEGIEPDPNVPRNMIEHVRKVLPGINIGNTTEWRNFRSYLPDTLPVISRSHRAANLFYLFGLSSAGMINGASSGKALARMWNDQPAEIDVSPFDIGRFRSGSEVARAYMRT